MSDLPFRTEWQAVSPTTENSKVGIRRALVVLAACLAGGYFAPFEFWTLAAILVGVAALFSIAFDLRRLKTGTVVYKRIQFDHRRIERVWREEPSGKEHRCVVAYDALEKVNVSKGSIGLYSIGKEWPEVFGIEEFLDEEMVLALLGRVHAKGVRVLVSEDAPSLKAAWSQER